MKSHVIVRERITGTEIPALDRVVIEASSDALGWQGLRLEVGYNHGCNLDDVTVDGHYLVLNESKSVLHFEARDGNTWVSGRQPPQTFWINAEGRPFSMRHSQEAHWVSAIIDGSFLDSVMDHHHEVRPATAIADPLLVHLMRGLVSRLYDQNSNIDLDRELIRAFVFALATRHASRAAELPTKGGIAPNQLKSLMAWLGEHIGESLAIDALAAQVGLSVAHFSREFKRSTGITPWGYVVQLRLDRARQLLMSGESIGITADKCGFSDHSHLSKMFKMRFGISPMAFIRECSIKNGAPKDGQPTTR